MNARDLSYFMLSIMKKIWMKTGKIQVAHVYLAVG